MSNNYPLNFYNRMAGSFNRAYKVAPKPIEDLMEALGDSIYNFAPYVGTELAIDPKQIETIVSLDSSFRKLEKLVNNASKGTGEAVFAQNLIMVFHMARNSIKSANGVGDALLVDIATQCGKIAEALL